MKLALYSCSLFPTVEATNNKEVNVTQYQWIFRPAHPDGGRDYGNSNIHSLRWDLGTLVRETIQNSTDARLPEAPAVGMEFRLIELSGEDLDRFFATVKWNEQIDQYPGLYHHLQATASESGQKLGKSVRAALKRLGRYPETLRLLRIDDWGTRGLTGPERDPGNFTALCRNNLDSNKAGTKAAGGSYGLGKSVLWRASDVATVLFHSDLDQESAANDNDGKWKGRLFGRSDLGWHVREGTEYSGPGWFGRTEISGDTEYAASLWNDPDLAETLKLVRTREGNDFQELPDSGTSILVVAFNDPGRDKEKESLEEIGEGLSKEISESFWPALESGALRAVVSIWKNNRQVSRQSVEPIDYPVAPYIRAVRAFKNHEVTTSKDALKNIPGGVYTEEVALEVPSKVAGDDQHGEFSHSARLIVRHLKDDEQRDHASTVAFLRGNEMIIEQRSVPVTGGIPYVAAVLCGIAAGTGEQNSQADGFLRAAEPPSHTAWILTEEVKADYKWGAGSRIARFLAECEHRVRDICRPPTPKTGDGPEALKKLFRFGTEPAPPENVPVLHADGFVRDNIWHIAGKITVPAGSGWKLQPILRFSSESKVGTKVDWQHMAVDEPGMLEDGWVIAVNAISKTSVITFEARSDPETHPVDAALSAVDVSVLTLTKGGAG